MKKLVIISSLFAVLTVGVAHAAEFDASFLDHGLIHLTSGDGLDREAYSEGNDRTGGMWQGAVAGSERPMVPAVETTGSYGRRQWSHYQPHPHHHNRY